MIVYLTENKYTDITYLIPTYLDNQSINIQVDYSNVCTQANQVQNVNDAYVHIHK